MGKIILGRQCGFRGNCEGRIGVWNAVGFGIGDGVTSGPTNREEKSDRRHKPHASNSYQNRLHNRSPPEFETANLRVLDSSEAIHNWLWRIARLSHNLLRMEWKYWLGRINARFFFTKSTRSPALTDSVRLKMAAGGMPSFMVKDSTRSFLRQ